MIYHNVLKITYTVLVVPDVQVQLEALNFLSPADGIKWRAIQRLIDPTAKLDDISERRNRKGGGGGKSRGKNNFKPSGGNSGGGNNSNTKRKPQTWQKKKRSAA